GVFEYKRTGEDPTRMFAGEGTAEQTNRRFHFVSKGQAAARLSTAFDSVTLYGSNPAQRMDIYGKIGNAGVSICTLDDAKRLYSGFDLCAPSTSVSMTINGPAPAILAFFMNSAIDAAIERQHKKEGTWPVIEAKIEEWFKQRGIERPVYRDDLPEGHDGMGLGFLGVSSDRIVDAAEYQEMKTMVLSIIRGTVQADILKEDQAQNTCIFSTEFALRAMADVQEYFIEHNVRNFYSVSISGYHIAEAGATPVSQLAFTLANGFTLLEYYRARGMDVNKFAPNLSFFFSNGLDPEYLVIGRVARRIWAIALRDLYGADERSQKLKYHIQTSGRSLHAQEVNFNDIRTTLQALYAIADNCNSLHTNAYDEAVTTPTEESVRRAIAIQLIINNECGLAKNENPLQGSYFSEYMTDLVEEAVLKEFEAIDRRGGVLGAMETMYQRSKIQEESMAYEMQKHNGDLKIIGVNTYINPEGEEKPELELRRSSDESKDMQIEQVASLKLCFIEESEIALGQLKLCARDGGNLFDELMEATKVCSLGDITDALFEVGGAYRRNM
ncbi:MAG: methylmalonyl-CoA mutase, partial [Planctomycetes bacterium]|nr:methylmalonyl-CoA mutase [Planctomycetota bacterium]